MCLIAIFMFSTNIWGVRACSCDILHSLVDIFTRAHTARTFCYVATAYFLHFHFHRDNLVCSYLSMARGDHQNDDDDFMDPPQQNRATRRRKEGDEVTVHTPSSSCICYWLPPRACSRLSWTKISWQWKHGNSWSFVCFLQKKKRTRNRASQEQLTSLTDIFTDDQKGAAAEMGMHVGNMP